MVNYSNRSNNNNSQRNNGDRVRCDILEEIGVIGQRNDGWTREVNIVSWNGGIAKVDLRDWDPEHNRMSRGITLLEEEAEKLTKVLARRYGLRLESSGPVVTRPGQNAQAGSAGELYESAEAADEPADAPFTAKPDEESSGGEETA